MKKLKSLLWTGELNNIPDGMQRFTGPLFLLFMALVPVALLQTLHMLDYLGPALGDILTYDVLFMVLDDLKQAGKPLTLALFLGLLLFAVGFRAWCNFQAFYGYKKNMRHYSASSLGAETASTGDFPYRHFYTFLAFNALVLLSMLFLALGFGLIASLMGFSFADGYELLKNIVRQAHQLAENHVPTIIELPPVIALVIIYTLTGFFHYWLHRLAHQFRLLWLVFHRPHHMPENLVEPVTTGVIVAFPLGFVVMFPYVLFFGTVAKLFAAEPLYLEIMILNLLVTIGASTAHVSSLWHLSKKYKWLDFLGHALGTAQYHYLHHASHPVYSHHNTNMTNIGGGFFFMWDRIFNTYVSPPVEKPAVGLTGQPALYMNPVRLLLSGLWQLIYELKNNKDWKTRLRILFGPAEYTPPQSFDFALAAN